MAEIKRWINFARWSDRSNCIGKGKVLDCGFTETRFGKGLYLKIEIEGVVYEGTLGFYEISEEEE
tara:strand:- start:68 stop:262 length:195 start_codon:yes stop_codon:yes gene_type:complete